MRYADKLKDPKWQKRRLEIFERDNWMCRLCKDDKQSLVVHHLCYFPKIEPWEYEDKYLLTLCEPCHEKNDFKTLGGLVDKIILDAFLQSRRRMLEDILENNYDPELSRQLDLVLCLLGA
jgi:hypothetical protein